MTSTHPLAARYLQSFEHALETIAPAERAELVAEIRQHIDDATAAGKSLEDILTSLGPAEQLARAYKVELLLNPRPLAARTVTREPRSTRWLAIVGLMALASVPSFTIIVTLASFGFGMTIAGVATFVAGIVDVSGILNGTVWEFHIDGGPPQLAIIVGPFVTLLGILAWWGLVRYVRFLVKMIRRVVPARATS
jgi:uncharacterized membrane protein